MNVLIESVKPIFENLNYSSLNIFDAKIVSQSFKSTIYKKSDIIIKTLNYEVDTSSLNIYYDYEFQNTILLEGVILYFLSSLNSPHFPTFISLNNLYNKPIILMNEIHGSTLSECHTTLSNDQKEVILFQLCYALYISFQFKFTHGDLIGSNILIESVKQENKAYNIEGMEFHMNNLGVNVKIIDFEYSRIEVYDSYIFNSYMLKYHVGKYAPPYSACIDICKLFGNPNLMTDNMKIRTRKFMEFNIINEKKFVIEPYQNFSIYDIFSSDIFDLYRINDFKCMEIPYVENLNKVYGNIREIYKDFYLNPLDIIVSNFKSTTNNKMKHIITEIIKIQSEHAGFNPIDNIKVSEKKWLSFEENIIFYIDDDIFCLKREYFDTIPNENIVNLVVRENNLIQYIRTFNSIKYCNLEKYGMKGIIKLSILTNALQSNNQCFKFINSDTKIDCINYYYLENEFKAYGLLAQDILGYKNYDSLIKYTYKWDAAVNFYLKNQCLSDKTLQKLDFYGLPDNTEQSAYYNINTIISDIDEEFLTTLKVEYELILYRGLSTEFTEGLNPCFVSGSLDKRVAELFGGDKFVCYLYIKNGVPILPLKSISKFPDEDEFLLPRGLIYTIFNIETIDEKILYHVNVELKYVGQYELNNEYRSYNIYIINEFYINDEIPDIDCKFNRIENGIVYDLLLDEPIDKSNYLKINNHCYNKTNFQKYIDTEYLNIENFNEFAEFEEIKDPFTRIILSDDILNLFLAPPIKYNGIYLSYIVHALKYLTSLELTNKNLIYLTDLNHCVNLVELKISSIKINTLSSLLFCVNLKYLKLKTISQSFICPHLEELDLSNSTIDDITSLSNCTNLKSLNLSSTEITDIDTLNTCHTLTTLNLSYTEITNIDALNTCHSLTTLDLNNTEIEDISSLLLCKELEYLFLNKTNIRDILPLKYCNILISLNLEETYINDISILANCTILKTLNLSGTLITDISALAGCTVLEDLNLNKTNIRDIKVLAKYIVLEYLNLAGTLIADISPLSNCKLLTNLNLSKTLIIDINPLVECKALEYLNLSGTLITDISPLSQCNALINLNLNNTNISDISPLINIKTLKSLQLDNTSVVSIYELGSLVRSGLTIFRDGETIMDYTGGV